MKKASLTLITALCIIIGLNAQNLQQNLIETNNRNITGITQIQGDANCDGQVDILDAISMSSYVLGYNPEPFCFSNADINGDGEVNLNDLILTVNIILSGGSFTCGISTITDIDGNIYKTVLIGEQCWMASSLNVTHTPDGEVLVRECYNHEPSYCELYGGLYSWATVMNGAGSSATNPSGVQGICPSGWHVPSDDEWTQLTDYVGANVTNGHGNALKSCRQENSPLGDSCDTYDHPRWDYHSTQFGTDDYGFSALPGGSLNAAGQYLNIGLFCNLWSSTESSATWAWRRYIVYDGASVNKNQQFKTLHMSVRCVKD